MQCFLTKSRWACHNFGAALPVLVCDEHDFAHKAVVSVRRGARLRTASMGSEKKPDYFCPKHSINPAFNMKSKLALFSATVILAFFPPIYGQTPADQRSVKKPVTTNDDAAGLKPGPYQGVKHRIRVSDIVNKSAYSAWSAIEPKLKTMLRSSLAATDQFVIVDPNLALGAPDAKPRFANYVATVEVLSIDEGQGTDTKVSFGKSIWDQAKRRLPGANVQADVALRLVKSTLSVNVEIVDATSGVVVASERVKGDAEKQSTLISGRVEGVQVSQAAFSETSLGEAAQRCIDNAVQLIQAKMKASTIESEVLDVDKGEVTIAMGKNYGIQTGQKLSVQEPDRVVRDSSGVMKRLRSGRVTGTIEIVTVEAEVAVCKLLDGDPPQKLDRVVVK